VGGLLAALSSDADPALFRTGGTRFDVHPPAVTVVVAPPPFSNQATVSFSVSADDGPNASGVKSVLARNGDGQTLSAVPSDAGVWTFPAVPVGQHPDFDVWAVDEAGNSGESLPVGPHHLRLSCLLDAAPPVVLQDFSVPSYRDERVLALGSPAVPPVFVWPGNPPPVPVGPGPEHAIWKTSVRLSAPAPLGASELEGPDAANIPFLQVGIPFTPGTDAPIASVTYRLSVEGVPDASGPLLPAARTAPGTLFFDLPLSAETIPGLTIARTSPVRFTVSVTATDAAGNGTTVPLASSDPVVGGTFLFHILGPPLFLEEDTGYPGAGDPRSIFPFSLADGTYAAKFAGDPAGEPARVARFRLWNPFPEPVPVSPGLSGFSATGTEEWDDRVWRLGAVDWDVLGGGCQGAVLSPCSAEEDASQPFQRAPGGAYACEAPLAPTSHPNPPVDVFGTTDGRLSAWTSGLERPADTAAGYWCRAR